MARQRRTPPPGASTPAQAPSGPFAAAAAEALTGGLGLLQRQVAALADSETFHLLPAQEQLQRGGERLAQGVTRLRQAQEDQGRGLAAVLLTTRESTQAASALTVQLHDQVDAAARLAASWERLSLSQQTLAGGLRSVGRTANEAVTGEGLLAEGQRKLTLSTTGLTLAYGLAAGSLLGWVRAGLAGTVQGERLAFVQQQLARQIASVFLPGVEALTRGLERLTDWFRRLDGAQQEHIRRWGEAAVAFLGFVVLVPRLTAGLATLRTALAGLVVGNPFLAVAAGLTGLLALTERGRERLADVGGKLAEALTPAAQALTDAILPGLEALSALLATAGGQVVLFGTLGVLAFTRLVAVVTSLRTALSTLPGFLTALSAGLAAIAVGIFSLARAPDEFEKGLQKLEQQVRSGRLRRAEAERETDLSAAEEAFRRRTQTLGGRGAEAYGLGEELERRTREGLQAQARGRLRAAGGERSDVLPSRAGEEDPRAVIRRLEAAVLRTGGPDETTASNTTGILKLMHELAARFPFSKQDNRERPDMGA